MNKLNKSFYERDAIVVAKELIGKYLVHNYNGRKLVGKIVETEAYMGAKDKAAHSYNYRRTKRNEVMYGPAGHTYIYLIYGMYYCFNIVTNNSDNPQGVLIRALEPIAGIEEMAYNRYKQPLSALKKAEVYNLTSGPGKLTQALQITKEHYGTNLLSDKIYVLNSNDKYEIKTSPRINIDYAEEAIHYPWRFYIKGNNFVSKPHD